MRSRILALIAVAFLGSTPIGSPITGWIGDHVSAEWSLAYGSVITLGAAVLAAAILARSRSTKPMASESMGAPAPIDHVVPS